MFTMTMLRFVTLHTVADGANVRASDEVHLHLLHLLHQVQHLNYKYLHDGNSKTHIDVKLSHKSKKLLILKRRKKIILPEIFHSI